MDTEDSKSTLLPPAPDLHWSVIFNNVQELVTFVNVPAPTLGNHLAMTASAHASGRSSLSISTLTQTNSVLVMGSLPCAHPSGIVFYDGAGEPIAAGGQKLFTVVKDAMRAALRRVDASMTIALYQLKSSPDLYVVVQSASGVRRVMLRAVENSDNSMVMPPVQYQHEVRLPVGEWQSNLTTIHDSSGTPGKEGAVEICMYDVRDRPGDAVLSMTMTSDTGGCATEEKYLRGVEELPCGGGAGAGAAAGASDVESVGTMRGAVRCAVEDGVQYTTTMLTLRYRQTFQYALLRSLLSEMRTEAYVDLYFGGRVKDASDVDTPMHMRMTIGHSGAFLGFFVVAIQEGC